MHPESLAKGDENMINDLDYEEFNFLFQKKITAELKDETIFH